MTDTHNDVTVTFQDEAGEHELGIIKEGVVSEAVKAGMDRMRSYAVVMHNKKREIVGGAVGYTMYGMLYIDLLWISSRLRKNGFGTQLLKATESLGRERQCNFCCLVTMSWQALSFYEKHGYSIEYVREGFRKETKMYMLRKVLMSHK